MNCWWCESIAEGDRKIPQADAQLCKNHRGIWRGYEVVMIETMDKPLGSFEIEMRRAIDAAIIVALGGEAK